MTRDEIIEQNLGLVHACARRFVGKGIEYDDLYSAGCVGLIKAVDRFDESTGCRLSTYAVPVILGEIRALFRCGGSVRLSRSLQELSIKARRIAEDHQRDTGEDIRIEELARRLGVEPSKATEALTASRAVLSLSYEGEDGEHALDIPVPSVEESLTEHLSLGEVLSYLPSDDRELIRLRYYQHKTQTQTARVMNTTQVQISRREKKILARLRAMLL